MQYIPCDSALLAQEVHYHMVYIAYFTELNSKIWDYAQKRRICRENCKYAFDERFHGHFCPRRKPAKSCHPVWMYCFVPLYFPTSYQYLIIRRGQNSPHKAFAGLLYMKSAIAFNFNPSLLQECSWYSIMKSTDMSPASFSIMLPFAKVQQNLIFAGKAHTYHQGGRS